MATAGGLSRRRVPQQTSDDDGTPSATTPSTPTPTPRPNGVQHAGTAMEGGNRVAYDPRDLDTATKGARMPRLTILEEILLLGIKDKAGYLSFWNDNISYALRGCILIELALRRRIAVVRDAARKRFPLPDRFVEVVDDSQTGETILDEALKMIKTTEEKMGIGSWVDLLSGETWNVLKIGFQLKQVRERLAKGLVDKGVLRTEKRNFLLFDMATHPVVDSTAKEEIRKRARTALTARTVVLPGSQYLPEEMEYRYFRTLAMICAAYAANVLENVLTTLQPEARERAYAQVDYLLKCYSRWPFAKNAEGNTGIGANLWQIVNDEVNQGKDRDLHLQVVAACLSVFGELDSLL